MSLGASINATKVAAQRLLALSIGINTIRCFLHCHSKILCFIKRMHNQPKGFDGNKCYASFNRLVDATMASHRFKIGTVQGTLLRGFYFMTEIIFKSTSFKNVDVGVLIPSTTLPGEAVSERIDYVLRTNVQIFEDEKMSFYSQKGDFDATQKFKSPNMPEVMTSQINDIFFSSRLVRTLCTFLRNAPSEDAWPSAQEQHIGWFSHHLNDKMFKMLKDEKDNPPKHTSTLSQLLVMTLEFMSAAPMPFRTATSRIFSDGSGSGGDGCLGSAAQEVAGDRCSRWSQNRFTV